MGVAAGAGRVFQRSCIQTHSAGRSRIEPAPMIWPRVWPAVVAILGPEQEEFEIVR